MRSGAGTSGKALDPRAGGDDGRARVDIALGGLDADAAAMLSHRQGRGARPDIGAGGLRLRDHRSDRGLDRDEATVGLEYADMVRRDFERRKAPHGFGRVHDLVQQPVQPAGRERARHHFAVRRADLGDAGDVEELRSRRGLKLAPQRIGPAQQRHIGRMLEIAEPDDAALAVRRALVVPRHKAFDADNADAAARELMQRRASHRAEPDHDHVELRHRQ